MQAPTPAIRTSPRTGFIALSALITPPHLARRAGHNPAPRRRVSHPCPGDTSRRPPPSPQKAFTPTPQFWFRRAPSRRCPLLMPPSNVRNLLLVVAAGGRRHSYSFSIPTIHWLNWCHARVPRGHQPGQPEGTARVLSSKPSPSPSHSLLNPSRIIGLCLRRLLLELLQDALPVLLQLLPKRPQLQAVQLQTGTHPQPAVPGWDIAVPGEKPGGGTLGGMLS